MAGMKLEELQAQLAGLEKYQAKTQEELQAQAESLYKGQYEQNLKLLQDSIQSSLAQQQRSVLDRGMQRSSYNQAQQAIIRGKGLDAQAQLGTDYSANVAQTLLNLMNTEYDRQNEADRYRNELLFTLYDMRNKGSGGGTPKDDPNKDNGTNLDPFTPVTDIISKSNLSGTQKTLYNKPNYKVFQTIK